MLEPDYPVALWPWSEYGQPPPRPEYTVCNESWFIAQGLAEAAQADSEAVSADDYTQDESGKWTRASESREDTGKGGIAL